MSPLERPPVTMADLWLRRSTAFHLVDLADPLPTPNELAALIGVVLPLSEPGDRFAGDVDLALYWPQVRPVWQEPRTR